MANLNRFFMVAGVVSALAASSLPWLLAVVVIFMTAEVLAVAADRQNPRRLRGQESPLSLFASCAEGFASLGRWLNYMPPVHAGNIRDGQWGVEPPNEQDEPRRRGRRHRGARQAQAQPEHDQEERQQGYQNQRNQDQNDRQQAQQQARQQGPRGVFNAHQPRHAQDPLHYVHEVHVHHHFEARAIPGLR